VVGDLVHEVVGQLEYDRAGLVVDHPGGRQHGVVERYADEVAGDGAGAVAVTRVVDRTRTSTPAT